MTHEDYCSLETAKLLKQAGFDWECLTYYRNRNERLNFGEEPIDWNRQHSQLSVENDYSAPTLSVAQRWLREVKHIDVFVWISCLQNYKWIGKNIGLELDFTVHTGENLYTTYEEALEAGIKKCLTLILEKDGR